MKTDSLNTQRHATKSPELDRPRSIRSQHIREQWDEGCIDQGGDGYWIALKPGWKSADDPVGALHCIHENTRKEALKVGVLPCNCKECRLSPSITTPSLP